MKHSKEIVKLGNELLKISCRKAIERSRETEGTYKECIWQVQNALNGN